MSLHGKNQLIAQALIDGERVDCSAVALPDLVRILDEVNDFLSSGQAYEGEARTETDIATLEAVRRLASEAPSDSRLAHELVYCLIGMVQGAQKTEAFETLFSHLPPRGKADALNDLLAQLNDAVTFGEADKAEELSGLLAKHAGQEGHPLRIGDILGGGAVFTVGAEGAVVFRDGNSGTGPGFDNAP